MIVVLGSSHDAVAMDLVALWPQAVLCSAEDLVSAGWVWRREQPASRIWVVNRRQIPDEEVTGVFVRRSSVYPEELITTHPEDRVFLAAEIHAFLVFVLASTFARVVNPISDGAFGEEALRAHRWSALALQLGISIRPLRVTNEPHRPIRFRTLTVEVVGDEVFGEAPSRLRESALRLAQALGLGWGVFVFDTRQRLVTITAARQPSNSAAAALGRFLETKRT